MRRAGAVAVAAGLLGLGPLIPAAALAAAPKTVIDAYIKQDRPIEVEGYAWLAATCSIPNIVTGAPGSCG